MIEIEDQIILPDTFFKDLQQKHLLLDTCFFIDLMFHTDAFLAFVKECKAHHITLTSQLPVAIEFTVGLTSSKEIQERLELIDFVIEQYYLPVDAQSFSYVQRMLLLYGKRGKLASLTDLILAGTAARHKNDLCLVTKNLSDFKLDVFKLQQHFVHKNVKSLAPQLYGIYKFAEGISNEH